MPCQGPSGPTPCGLTGCATLRALAGAGGLWCAAVGAPGQARGRAGERRTIDRNLPFPAAITRLPKGSPRPPRSGALYAQDGRAGPARVIQLGPRIGMSHPPSQRLGTRVTSARAHFDDSELFEPYAQHRAWSLNPDIAMERPALSEELGPVSGLRALDLGCGDAEIGREPLNAGAACYRASMGPRG